LHTEFQYQFFKSISTNLINNKKLDTNLFYNYKSKLIGNFNVKKEEFKKSSSHKSNIRQFMNSKDNLDEFIDEFYMNIVDYGNVVDNNNPNDNLNNNKINFERFINELNLRYENGLIDYQFINDFFYNNNNEDLIHLNYQVLIFDNSTFKWINIYEGISTNEYRPTITFLYYYAHFNLNIINIDLKNQQLINNLFRQENLRVKIIKFNLIKSKEKAELIESSIIKLNEYNQYNNTNSILSSYLNKLNNNQIKSIHIY
jgi:hypothetical protein